MPELPINSHEANNFSDDRNPRVRRSRKFGDDLKLFDATHPTFKSRFMLI